MTVNTYEEARALVEAEIAPLWRETSGTFYVATSGLEDDRSYFVQWGAREWLVDENPEYILVNGAATFVDKATGIVEHSNYINEVERIMSMREVSSEG